MRRFISVLVLLASLVARSSAPAAHAWTWPAAGPVLRPFSLGADTYAGGQHRGVDIGAELGSPVLAPAAGTVSFVGSIPQGGRAVTIQTADGYAVTLLQLGSTSVLRGSVVAEGAVVGVVGESADAVTSAPHVHLGVRVAADPDGYVDPLGLLPAAVAATRARAAAARPRASARRRRRSSRSRSSRPRRRPTRRSRAEPAPRSRRPSRSLSRSRPRRWSSRAAPRRRRSRVRSSRRSRGRQRPAGPSRRVQVPPSAERPGAGSPRRRCADRRRPERADCRRTHDAAPPGTSPKPATARPQPPAALERPAHGVRPPPRRSRAPPWRRSRLRTARLRAGPRRDPLAAHARRARVCRTRRREGQAQACAYHEWR